MGRRPEIHHEVTALMAYMLLTVKETLIIVDEFLPTIPKDDTYEDRMKGLQTMKQGVTTVFSGAEVSLSETKIYDASDLSVLLRAMAECLPVVDRSFSSATKQEFSRKLQSRMNQFTGPEDREALTAMLSILQAKPNHAPEPTSESATPRAP